MKLLWGYILLVALSAIVAAIVINALLTAMPGAIVILPFIVCWWATELPRYDLDAELVKLLMEGR